MSELVGNHKDKIPPVVAHIISLVSMFKCSSTTENTCAFVFILYINSKGHVRKVILAMLLLGKACYRS